MNLKILVAFLLYYGFISAVFLFGQAYLGGATTTIDLNQSSLTSGDLDNGGAFTTGISFTRYLAFVGFGIGLPADTPSWFQICYSLFAIGMNIFLVAWLLSSIWNG